MEKPTITFIEKKNKGVVTATFCKELEKVLSYWQGIGTVRKFKDKLFIQNVSFPYTIELMIKWKIPFKIVTEL